MSIFLKYNYNSLLIKKYKTKFKTIYLEKYTKPYKTPIRIAIFFLVYIFFGVTVFFTNLLKSLTTINVFSNNLVHHLLSTENLIN